MVVRRNMGAHRCRVTLTAVLVCLIVSSSVLYSMSEKDQEAAIGLPIRRLKRSRSSTCRMSRPPLR